MNHERTVHTEKGVLVDAYAFHISEHRETEAIVFSISYYPLSTTLSISKNEARQVAEILIAAADNLDGGTK